MKNNPFLYLLALVLVPTTALAFCCKIGVTVFSGPISVAGSQTAALRVVNPNAQSCRFEMEIINDKQEVLRSRVIDLDSAAVETLVLPRAKKQRRVVHAVVQTQTDNCTAIVSTFEVLNVQDGTAAMALRL